MVVETPEQNANLEEQEQLHNTNVIEKAKQGRSIAERLNADRGKKPENLKDQAVDRAKQRANETAKRIAKQAAKAVVRAVKAIGRQLVMAVAANPYFWAVIGVIAVVIIILLLIFALFGLGGDSGGGPAVYPETADQKYQVTELLGFSNDQLGQTNLIKEAVEREKKRLTIVKSTINKVYSTDSAKAKAAKDQVDQIISLMDQIPAQGTVEKKKELIAQISEKMRSVNSTYPELAGLGAISGSYLLVPGVKEATQGDCGQASILMVVLYYKPDFQDNQYYDSAKRATKDNLNCVNPTYISKAAGVDGWQFSSAPATNLENVKKSLAGGDPVIIYTQPGSIYSGSKHIFVIVGYDPADDTFFVNNPYPGGVNLHTKTPNSVKMTSVHLKDHFGQSIYDHTFLMRSKYAG